MQTDDQTGAALIAGKKGLREIGKCFPTNFLPYV